MALYKDRHRELWNKCTNCGELVFKQALERNSYTCPNCDYYSPMPADGRLRYLFDSEAIFNLHPASIDKQLLDSIGMADLVDQNRFPDESQWLASAGEGTISNCPTVLAVVAPYAVPQRVHFVTLLVAIRTALEKKLPFITVYPSDALAKKRSDPPEQPELSPTEITYLTIEMDNLSQARLPQITILTDQDRQTGFLTQFPLGDVVLAEQNRMSGSSAGRRTHSSRGESSETMSSLSSYTPADVSIDYYVQRQDLPARLGKLLAFFAK
ncbi:hypothetical protein J4G02_04770 [Candidatus Poribacteria bacterium]|nr:hypothetical protein [Candidatus Poribacteria bacterium]